MEASTGSSGRILVVDDDQSSADALAELLREEGHDATLAISVAEAMTALRRGQYHLLLIDPSLRETGGREVLDLAKTLGVPTLIITSDPAYDPERTRNDGVTGFLYKPLHWPTLLGLIASALKPARPA